MLIISTPQAPYLIIYIILSSVLGWCGVFVCWRSVAKQIQATALTAYSLRLASGRVVRSRCCAVPLPALRLAVCQPNGCQHSKQVGLLSGTSAKKYKTAANSKIPFKS